MNENPVVNIEFTGIGGVGKSTIVELVCKSLEQSRVPFNDLTKFNYKKIRAIYFIAFFKAIYLTALSRPNSFKGFINTLKGFISVVFLSKDKNKDNKITLYDEGIVHKIRALRRNSFEQDMLVHINRIFKYIEIPDVLIVIEAPAELIYERKLKRNRINDNVELAFIVDETKDENFIKTLDALEFGNYKYKKRLKVIRLKNIEEDDVINNANKIISFIKDTL